MDYFLKNVNEDGVYENIFVYCIKPLNSLGSLANDSLPESIRFIQYEAPDFKKPGEGKRIVASYTLYTIRHFLKRYKRDDLCICVGTTFVALVGIILKVFLRRKIKLVSWIRSIAVKEMQIDGSRSYRLAKFLEKRLLSRSDLILANGIDTYEHYSSEYSLGKNKIFTIFNAVQTSDFKGIKNPRFEKGIRIVVSYIGRLVEGKGFLDFVNCVEEFYQRIIGKERINIEFRVYGDGIFYGISSDKLKYFGVFQPRELLGFIDDIDLILFLNHSKVAGGVSHGLLEAMAAGRLIVAWDNLIHNQVLNRNNSILIKEGSNEELISLFIRINHLNDKDKYDFLEKCDSVKKDSERYSVEQHMITFNSFIDHLYKSDSNKA